MFKDFQDFAENFRKYDFPGCPVGWTRFKQSCYKLNTTEQYYKDSEKGCVAHGAHVASVASADENNFLLKMAMDSSASDK